LYEDEGGYTLNVYTASGKEEHTLHVSTAKMDTPSTSTLQEIEKNTPCTPTVQAVEKGCNLYINTTCNRKIILTSTLLVVERKTPLRSYFRL
jgi:hypothetical protein